MEKNKNPILKFPVILCIVFLMIWFTPILTAAKETTDKPLKKTEQKTVKQVKKDHFKELQTRLVKDGFDPKIIDKLYKDKKVEFASKSVSLYFLHNEAKLDYSKMTKKAWINQGRKYMKKNAATLKKAEKKYGVDPKVITAIMLVETKFGRYVGRHNVFNTLSTMATLTESEPREHLWKQLPKKRRYKRKRYDQKADQKSKWAYKELKAFLTYTRQFNIDPTDIKGSYAGALGLAQFMPSNILLFGQDGNNDNQIDLFDDTDAIYSIANYLKHYGWKPGIKRKKAYKVIWHYNHSKYYVNTVLKISDLLKEKAKS